MTISFSTVARAVHDPQTFVMRGARIKTAGNGEPKPEILRERSNDSFCRPNALRATCISIAWRSQTSSRCSVCSFASSTQPAQVPINAIEPCFIRRRITSYNPEFTTIRDIVVLSPPGMINPSHLSTSEGRRIKIALPEGSSCAKIVCKEVRCSETAPWTDKTPTVTIFTDLVLGEAVPWESY